nr:MAG TPA: BRO family protein [Caudoviricetes sp.]
MSQSLCFHSVEFDVIPQNSQPWVRGYQIGTALGYGENADVSIRKLYTRHADEFTPAMTAVVTLPTEGGPQETRIFSLRGCHLLAMFARTPVAKAFRRWVLDVIEQYGDRVPVAHPVTLNEAPISPEQRAELKLIVDSKAGMVPKAVQRRAYKEIWTRFNRHFHIAEYKQLPCSRMDEARDFLLSMQVNAGKIEALSQAALPSPCAAHPVIDEKPFLEFIEEIQAAHEEVDRILSRLHHSVFTLSWKVAEALEQRADIRLYLVPDMLSENTLRGYLHQSVYHDVKKALTAPGRQLEQYSNPGYSLLGIVRQLNGNGRA